MMDMTQQLSLVDYLGERLGGMYLSDLHRPEMRLWLHKVILDCPSDYFPLRDWLDALQYLTPLTPPVSMTAEIIRTQLLDFFQSPQSPQSSG